MFWYAFCVLKLTVIGFKGRFYLNVYHIKKRCSVVCRFVGLGLVVVWLFGLFGWFCFVGFICLVLFVFFHPPRPLKSEVQGKNNLGSNVELVLLQSIIKAELPNQKHSPVNLK